MNRYIWLAESVCSVNYVQPYVFKILEENLHDMAHFRGYQLFSGWFHVMSVVSWVVSCGFSWFQVVRCFSKYIDVLIKEAYTENLVGRGGLRK